MDDDKQRPTDEDAGETSSALTRRQALMGAGLVGLVVSGGGALAACSSDSQPDASGSSSDSQSNANGSAGPQPDPSRRELGGQPIYDAEPLDTATILPPLRDRVLALKSLLIGAGVLTEDRINMYIDIYQNKVGPQLGKAVVAHAWKDPAFFNAITQPPPQKPFAATGVIADFLQKSLGLTPLPGFRFGPEGEWLRVVANGKDAATGQRVHNMVACTVCSCYPQALLGAQPIWYKSQQYRARSVRAPRGVMAEFAEAQGPAMVAKLKTYLALIDEVRVWDSNSEARFLVIPEMPPQYKGLSEQEMVQKITRNSMVGVEIL